MKEASHTRIRVGVVGMALAPRVVGRRALGSTGFRLPTNILRAIHALIPTRFIPPPTSEEI
jgi:hypothetical protein